MNKFNYIDKLYKNKQNENLINCLSTNTTLINNLLSINTLTLFPYNNEVLQFIFKKEQPNQFKNFKLNYLNNENNDLINQIKKNKKLKSIIGLNIVKQLMNNNTEKSQSYQHIVLSPGVAIKFINIER